MLLEERASVSPHIGRVREFEASYPQNFDAGTKGRRSGLLLIDSELKPRLRLTNFAKFICNRVDSLHLQLQANESNSVYASQLMVIATAPKQNVPKLIGSIVDNWKAIPGLSPFNRKLQKDNCELEVRNLVALPVEETKQIAPLALVLLVKDFAIAANELLEGILSITDEQVRAQKLKKYILSSKEQVAKNFYFLTGKNPQNIILSKEEVNQAIDKDAFEICKKFKWKAPCNSDSKTNPPTVLDGLQIYEKWTALRRPWHLYITWQLWRDSIDITLPNAPQSLELQAMRVEDYRRMEQVENALKGYLALRLLPAPKDIAKGMEKAQSHLIDVAEGRLTVKEATVLFEDLASRYKKIKEASDKVISAWAPIASSVKGF